MPSVYTPQGGELREEAAGPLQALAFGAAPPLRAQGHLALALLAPALSSLFLNRVDYVGLA